MSSKRTPASETPRTGVVHKIDLPYAIEEDVPLPASTGRAGREPSSLHIMFDALKPGKGTFFIPADQPAETITDGTERETARMENAKKLRQGVMNSARHYCKKDANKDKKFGAVVTKAEGGAVGVRVGRTA